MKATHADKCPSVEQLADCLDPVADAAAEVTIHLEKCETCRQTLSFLAGGPQWWEAAESFLSAESTSELSASESRVTQRVCALTGSNIPGQQDQLTEQEAQQLKQLLAPPSHPELMGRINRYELEQLVGRGGMGLVFRAYDTELNRTVAVKILALHLIAIGSARERFIREARAVASLSHPHIVPMYDVVTDGEVPALVMQFIAGETLQHRISRRGALPVEDVLQIGIQLADALALAHSHGLVHRDIKPGNVLLEADGSRALLSDFGLVRALDDATLTHSGLLAGTPDYMSPEQARGHSVDARSDLFSLGSVLYTMLVGHPPFRAPEPMAVLNRICHERHRSACAAEPRVPIEVSQLIDRLLTKDTKHRIASAEMVRDRLRDMAKSPRRLQVGRRWLESRISQGVLAASILTCLATSFAFAPAAQQWMWPSSLPAVISNAATPSTESGSESSSEQFPDELQTTASAYSFVELQMIDRLLGQLNSSLQALQRMATNTVELEEVKPFETLDSELQQLEQELLSLERNLDLQTP
ncbi:MAG: serine/threonine-protein kinase [Pirellulaceae bacterium]|nr:serine/threonine-protein kinase [Pirellulaceae bacterium]